MAQNAIGGRYQFLANSGAPLALGYVITYAAGTTTLQSTYTDAGLTQANLNSLTLANTLILDQYGRCNIYWLPLNYKLALYDSTGTLLDGYPIDNVAGSLWPGLLAASGTLSPAANANGLLNQTGGTINKASSGTHALFAANYFATPTIGAGASTLTESTTLYVQGAPATGTNQYAFHVASGLSLLDGALTCNGAVTFNVAPTGKLFNLVYVAKTANYTAVANDLVSCTSGTFTVTLPLASSNANRVIEVANNGTGTITVGRTSSDTIGLATSQTLAAASASAQGDALTFYSDGISNWIIL